MTYYYLKLENDKLIVLAHKDEMPNEFNYPFNPSLYKDDLNEWEANAIKYPTRDEDKTKWYNLSINYNKVNFDSDLTNGILLPENRIEIKGVLSLSDVIINTAILLPESKESSQDELWEEIYLQMSKHFGNNRNLINRLKQNYSLTKK